MFINWALKEIHLKIIYYGPGLCGKTESLKYIYSHIDPSLKGDLIMLKSNENRTIFFDFLQLEIGHIDDKKPKFNLYTVPGQVNFDLTRKVVLSGVDGIIFVADSQKEMMDANLETLLGLEKHLINTGRTLENFPWIMQYNKRDLPTAEDVQVMEKKLNYFKVPSFETVAINGKNIFPALKEIIKQVVTHVHSDISKDMKKRA